jgi:hypothetical protein
MSFLDDALLHRRRGAGPSVRVGSGVLPRSAPLIAFSLVKASQLPWRYTFWYVHPSGLTPRNCTDGAGFLTIRSMKATSARALEKRSGTFMDAFRACLGRAPNARRTRSASPLTRRGTRLRCGSSCAPSRWHLRGGRPPASGEQGAHSVGVQWQYGGALSKTAAADLRVLSAAKPDGRFEPSPGRHPPIDWRFGQHRGSLLPTSARF